jgi:phosphomannomutase
MCKYKNVKGKIVTAFSTTPRVKKICDHYGLPLEIVPIGFKFIAAIMEKEEVLIGGEESGGIAIKGHIPERDGIWIGLVLAEFLALSGKKLDQLIEEVYEITGPFVFHRNDLHLEEEQKQKVVQKCKSGSYKNFGSYAVERVENMDGFKFFLGNDEWIMIRPSGTEPVLRVYAESSNRAGVDKIINEALEVILA